EVADLPIILAGIRDVVDVTGLELARGLRGGGAEHRCRHRCRCCRETQALNELAPVHFSLFEILEQFCDDVFHEVLPFENPLRDGSCFPGWQSVYNLRRLSPIGAAFAELSKGEKTEQTGDIGPAAHPRARLTANPHSRRPVSGAAPWVSQSPTTHASRR